MVRILRLRSCFPFCGTETHISQIPVYLRFRLASIPPISRFSIALDELSDWLKDQGSQGYAVLGFLIFLTTFRKFSFSRSMPTFAHTHSFITPQLPFLFTVPSSFSRDTPTARFLVLFCPSSRHYQAPSLYSFFRATSFLPPFHSRPHRAMHSYPLLSLPSAQSSVVPSFSSLSASRLILITFSTPFSEPVRRYPSLGTHYARRSVF